MATRATDHGQTILLPVLAVLSGLAFFSAMDAVMKGLSVALGAYNAVFWRYAAGVVLVSALYLPRRPRRPSRQAMRLYLIRGVLIAIMAFLFFWGLVRVPLAEGVALSFIAPLIALYLAAILLRERIGRNAIFASLLGIAAAWWSSSLGKMEERVRARCAMGHCRHPALGRRPMPIISCCSGRWR